MTFRRCTVQRAVQRRSRSLSITEEAIDKQDLTTLDQRRQDLRRRRLDSWVTEDSPGRIHHQAPHRCRIQCYLAKQPHSQRRIFASYIFILTTISSYKSSNSLDIELRVVLIFLTLLQTQIRSLWSAACKRLASKSASSRVYTEIEG